MAEEYKIKLGVELDTDSLQGEINEASRKAKPIELDINLGDVSQDIKEIKNQLESLNKKGGISLNTESLEASLKNVSSLIDNIKVSIGKIDSKKGVTSLVTTVNKISKSLEKVSNQFDGLNKSLSALSGKDLNLNLNLKLGNSNPVTRNANYGQEVKKNVIPELERQISAYEDYLQDYYKKTLSNWNERNNAVGTLIKGNNLNINGKHQFQLLAEMADDSNLEKQISAYRDYIKLIQESARLQKVDVSSVASGFSDTADKIVQNAIDIKTGTKEAEESIEGFKKLLGSGINAEALTAQLDPIVQKLEEVRVSIENLSKTTAFDGLSEQFKNLSQTLNNLIDNYTLVKKNIDEIGDGLNNSSSVGDVDTGIKKIENDIRETTSVIDAAEYSIDSLKKTLNELGVNSTGIDVVTKDIQDMNVEVQKVKTEISGNNLKLSVTGLKEAKDGIKEVVTEIREIPDIISNPENVKRSVTETFETSLEKTKKEAKKINDVYSQTYDIKKKIGSLEVDLIGAEAKDDKQSIEDINAEIERLRSNLKTIDTNGLYTSKFTDRQKAELEELNKQIEYSKKQTQNSVDYKVNIQDAKDNFEELKRLAKEISNIKINILKSDDTTDVYKLIENLNKLENEYDELYNTIKLSNRQQSQLDGIVKQGDQKVLNEFNNELKEFVKLQNQIENKKFELGKLELLGGHKNEIAELNRQIEELESSYNRLMGKFWDKSSAFGDVPINAMSGLENGIAQATENAENRIKQFKAHLEDLRAEAAKKIELELATDLPNKIEKIKSSVKSFSGSTDELRANLKQIDIAMGALNGAIVAGDNEKIAKSYKELNLVLEKTEKQYKELKSVQQSANDMKALEQKKNGLSFEMDAWLKENSSAAKKFGSTIKELKMQLESCDSVDFNNIKQEFQNVQKEAKSLGLTTQTLGDQIKTKFKEYSAYFSVAEIFMYAEQGLRDMFEQVKLIDAAMTELKKVTNETDSAYNQFLTNAASRAKAIGTTIDGLVSSTADFAKLGYGFEEAQGLAEVANIYAVVGDEINGVEGATESLVSTLAAFKSEMNGMSDTDFAMSIVDKFNEVANRYSITSGGLGEAFQRSASSMEAANNSLDETIALITAANNVVQDPVTVGQAFKTKFLYCLYVQKCA